MTGKEVDAAIDTFLRLTTSEILRHAAQCFTAFVRYIIKSYSIKSYVFFHFKHKNDVTVIIKLHIHIQIHGSQSPVYLLTFSQPVLRHE